MSREARRLNELEADVAKLQALLIQKRRDLQMEIQLREQQAKKAGGGECTVESGNAWCGRNARENGTSCERFRSSSPTRNSVWQLLETVCDKAGGGDGGEMVPRCPSRVGTLLA